MEITLQLYFKIHYAGLQEMNDLDEPFEVTICKHSVEKQEIHSHKKIRVIKLIVIHFVKTWLSRNLYQNSVRVNFCNFHTVFRNRMNE